MKLQLGKAQIVQSITPVLLLAAIICVNGATHAQTPTNPQQASQPDPQLKINPIETLRNFEPAADEEYRLGRGDEITVDFAGRPDLTAKLVVGPDGRITLPLAGDIMLSGKTREQAAKDIETALSSYYTNLVAQVTVTKYTANKVLVLGAVEKPAWSHLTARQRCLKRSLAAVLRPAPTKPRRFLSAAPSIAAMMKSYGST